MQPEADNTAAGHEAAGPRFGVVPVWLLITSGLAALGLSGFLVYLGFDQWAEEDRCVDADLLAADKCQELHGDLGSTFLLVAIGALILYGGALTLALVARRRDRRRVAASGEEPTIGRDDATGEAPIRVCPVCSAQSKTLSDTCPHCGSSFIRARRLRASRSFGEMSGLARGALIAAVLVIPLAAASGAWALVTAGDRNDESRELSAAELERQKAEAAEAAADEAREAERAERSLRQIQVRELEKTITEDAQKESERSFSIIDGPILETQCDPAGGRVDTDAVAQNFDCLAIRKYTGDGSASGYRYSASINYRNFTYRWRLGGGGL